MPEEQPEGLPPEEEETQTEETSEEKQSSQLFPLIAVVLIALLGAYFVTNAFLKPMFAKNGTQTEVVEKKEEPKKEEHKSKDSHGSGHGHGEEVVEENTNFYNIDGIVVNPASTGGSRFLSTNISFELESPDGIETFKTNEIKIRDALNTILSSKTVTELSDLKTREMIRRQILSIVNKICKPEKAEAIYFVDFVLQ